MQLEFERQCPVGWACRREVSLLTRDLQNVLGYAPRADIVLERHDGSNRVWVEFEVSRADPVANHAKFATAHLFRPQADTECFVSMVSPHVTRGRRNLASNMILLLRSIGMRGFQTVLLPHLAADAVQRLNQLPVAQLAASDIDVPGEIERALAISSPLLAAGGRAIHLAGEPVQAMLNLRSWNLQIVDPALRELWGRRTITYFVFDPASRQFAPSKFCAYAPVPMASPSPSTGATVYSRSMMTIDLYASIEDSLSVFDGYQARTHLTSRLGMLECAPDNSPEVAETFRAWLVRNSGSVAVHPYGPRFILPPRWYH